MKKTFLIITLAVFCNIFAVAQSSPNPIVTRISPQEVAQCKTPEAIAYNYVIAILNKDYTRAASYMTEDIAQIWRELGTNALNKEFSTPGKLNIHGWEPALAKGYEVAIAYVQDTWYYEENGSFYYNPDQVVKDGMIYLPGENKPRVGINEKKVYVTCSPSSEINHVRFQDITRYGDTNVKVLLQKFNGVWKVMGFK